MKMAKPGICCDKCFDLIARRSTDAAKLWLDLCEIQEHVQVFAINSDDFLDLTTLENLGFVVTTDIPDFIVIKVLGHGEDGIGTFFCAGVCDYDE